jgi:uncharacterized paraquat-inducible protein A
MKMTLTVMIMTLLVCLVSRDTAHAYLNPGTGSFIFQVVITVFIGLAFSIKLFWQNIKNFVNRLFVKK